MTENLPESSSKDPEFSLEYLSGVGSNTGERKGAKERAKKIGTKTAGALGYLGLIGAGTIGMYTAVRSGNLDAVLPQATIDADDGNLLALSASTTISAIAVAHNAVSIIRGIRDTRKEKKELSDPVSDYEITDTAGREEDTL